MREGSGISEEGEGKGLDHENFAVSGETLPFAVDGSSAEASGGVHGLRGLV